MKSRLRRKVVKQFERETNCIVVMMVDPCELKRIRIARALKRKLWQVLDDAMEYYYSKQY